MDNTVSENTEKKTIEVKQSFFSSAISDISAYKAFIIRKSRSFHDTVRPPDWGRNMMTNTGNSQKNDQYNGTGTLQFAVMKVNSGLSLRQ